MIAITTRSSIRVNARRRIGLSAPDSRGRAGACQPGPGGRARDKAGDAGISGRSATTAGRSRALGRRAWAGGEADPEIRRRRVVPGARRAGGRSSPGTIRGGGRQEGAESTPPRPEGRDPIRLAGDPHGRPGLRRQAPARGRGHAGPARGRCRRPLLGARGRPLRRLRPGGAAARRLAAHPAKAVMPADRGRGRCGATDPPARTPGRARSTPASRATGGLGRLGSLEAVRARDHCFPGKSAGAGLQATAIIPGARGGVKGATWDEWVAGSEFDHRRHRLGVPCFHDPLPATHRLRRAA